MAVNFSTSGLALAPMKRLSRRLLAAASAPTVFLRPTASPFSSSIPRLGPRFPDFTSDSSFPPCTLTFFHPLNPNSGSFRPSIAVIIGVLVTMFCFTFLLLLYANYCRRNTGGVVNPEAVPPPPLRGRNSGVDRAIIDALPTFSFASVQGFIDGLECAVCLNKFEKPEMMRLLPKCKHGFHVECIDAWLASHSTCPLCRHKVEAEDTLVVGEILPENKINDHREVAQETGSRRTSVAVSSSSASNSSEWGDARTLQVYLQRESDLFDLPDLKLKSGIGNSSIRFLSKRQDAGSGVEESLLVDDLLAREEEELARRFGHRIIISDVVLQHRWSDFLASDVMLLNCHTFLEPSERLPTNAAPLFSTLRSNHRTARLSAGASLMDHRCFSFSARFNPSRLPTSKTALDTPRMSSSILASSDISDFNGLRSYSSRIEPRLSLNSKADLVRSCFSQNMEGVSPGLLSACRLSSPLASAHSTSIHDGSSITLDSARRFKDIEMGNMESSAIHRSTSNRRPNTNIIKANRPERETVEHDKRRATPQQKPFASRGPEDEKTLLAPSFQRSLSEFSGMERYVDTRKDRQTERDAETKRWLSIARRTLNWLKGSETSSRAMLRGRQPDKL